MIVVDASVLANAIADDGTDGQRARDELRAGGDLAAPDLIDVEVVAVLRKRWLHRSISERRFAACVGDLKDLDIQRWPALPLMVRAFELRRKVTPYDAAYVALAESLGGDLVTADAPLAAAPGLHCRVKLLR